MTDREQEQIYESYQEKVMAYLFNHVGRREDAEDLCSEVFEQVYRSLDRFDASKSSLSTWIYNITRYTLIDYQRTWHKGEEIDETLPSEGDIEADYIRRDTMDRLADALEALDEEGREIILLRYYEGCTLTRIASLTGTSYGMVRVKHKKALNALRLALEG